VEVPPDAPGQGPRRRALGGITAGYAVVAVFATGIRIGFPPQLRLDESASRALYAGDGRSAALEGLLQAITTPGYTWFRLLVLAPVVAWLVRRRAWWTAAWALTAAVLIGPLTTAVKDLVGRVRPDFAGGGAQLTSKSFPSGHASGIATLVTVVLVLLWPVLRPPARRAALAVGGVAVALVGLSRLWLGVHFLSDVLGGWAFGIAWTLTVALAFGALPGGRAALPARDPAGVGGGRR
jgi:membrane-associated phospholipid phosphatase